MSTFDPVNCDDHTRDLVDAPYPTNWTSLTFQEQADWFTAHRRERIVPATALRETGNQPAAAQELAPIGAYWNHRVAAWSPAVLITILGPFALEGVRDRVWAWLAWLSLIAGAVALGALASAVFDLAERSKE